MVDTGNSLLLAFTVCTAPKSLQITIIPLEYGREIYFWSFVVAVMVFALGAGVSFYEGVAHVLNPEPIRNAAVNYAVLGLSALFDGTTWWIALRNFKGRMKFSTLVESNSQQQRHAVLHGSI